MPWKIIFCGLLGSPGVPGSFQGFQILGPTCQVNLVQFVLHTPSSSISHIYIIYIIYITHLQYQNLFSSILARKWQKCWWCHCILSQWPDPISGCHYLRYCCCIIALLMLPPLLYNLPPLPSYWPHKYLSTIQYTKSGGTWVAHRGEGDFRDIILENIRGRGFFPVCCTGL